MREIRMAHGDGRRARPGEIGPCAGAWGSDRGLRLVGVVCAVLLVGVACADVLAARGRPNVVLIMTDDQGYGDLGFYGNPKIRTPQMDTLARQSVQFENFYVCPVCSPTRASLMTGRYNYRTGVVDTYIGRSMMSTDEVTIAEMLAAAGYRTGVFGKWHLGDTYPLRPMDQGFTESLVHRGGGIGQPADPPGNRYFDPVLQHNGTPVKSKGYCSDVFTDAAIRFITENRDRPFFVYLPFNCPHTPLQVADRDYLPYTQMNLSHSAFPAVGYPLQGKAKPDVTARVYGMITNIDDNLGRLFAKLDALGLADNTIVIFLTDNGPQQERYKAGLRGRKGSVYEGGIRVPCFIRWPARLKAGRKIDRIAAHIDIAPTLLEACGAAKPAGVSFDGVSLMPLLSGRSDNWPDRTLYFQWHRGDEPQLYRACAARSQRYKLVQPAGGGASKLPKKLNFELYDMQADPFEQKNIAAQHPDLVTRMKAMYAQWFRDVGSTRGYAPLRILLGTPHENPVVLTRQDWRSRREGWGRGAYGHWVVQVTRAGQYDITLRFDPTPGAETAHLVIGNVRQAQALVAGTTRHTFRAVGLPSGPARLEAWIGPDDHKTGVMYVDVKQMP